MGAAHGAERSLTCSWGQPEPPKPSGIPLVTLLPVLSELEGGRSSYRWTNSVLAWRKGGTGQGPRVTHHFEVFGGALLPTEEAGQQHLPNVVASPVIKLQHVERFGLEVSEVGLVLQDFQLLLISCLDVWDLVSWGKEQGGAQAWLWWLLPLAKATWGSQELPLHGLSTAPPCTWHFQSIQQHKVAQRYTRDGRRMDEKKLDSGHVPKPSHLPHCWSSSTSPG